MERVYKVGIVEGLLLLTWTFLSRTIPAKSPSSFPEQHRDRVEGYLGVPLFSP